MLLTGPSINRPSGSGLEFWLVYLRYQILWQNAQRVCEHFGGNLIARGMREQELQKYELIGDVNTGREVSMYLRQCLGEPEKCKNT